MRPTLQYIKDKFNYYNELCFNNSLPELPITLNVRNSQLGLTKFKTIRNADGTTTNYDFSIEISVRLDLPESEYIDTIVHEMIHYYIEYNNIKDDSEHGHIFMNMVKDIKQKYGITVTVSYNPGEEELINTITRYRYICIASLKDGTSGLAVVAKNKVWELWDIMPQISDVVSVKWYVSNRAIFNSFPVAVSPSLIIMDTDKAQRYLTGAQELEKSDNVIKIIVN